MPAQRASFGRKGVLVDALAVLAAAVSDGVRHPLDARGEQVKRLLDVRQGDGHRRHRVRAAGVLAKRLRGALQLIGASRKGMAWIGEGGVRGHARHRRPPLLARPWARAPIVQGPRTPGNPT
jgi:hypothetical protein